MGDRVLLRSVHFGIRAETKDSIAEAVEASNLAPIIRSFEVKAYGKDKAPVIEVTELFTKEVAEFNAKSGLSALNCLLGITLVHIHLPCVEVVLSH